MHNSTCEIFTYLTESQTLKRRKSMENKDINTDYQYGSQGSH